MKKKHIVILISALSALALAAVLLLMAGGLVRETRHEPIEAYRMPDTLRVGVLNSPSTYFNYRGSELGYDYELIERLAKDSTRVVELKVAYNFPDLMQMLEEDSIDIVASPVPVTAEFKRLSLACGPKSVTSQVVVQKRAEDMAKDVTDLVGRHVTVEKDSKFEYRLKNLNNELGGGIVIEPLERDTLVSEDLIKMVARGEILAAVVDSETAQLNLKDYPGLDASLHVSLDQESQWAVGVSNPDLAGIIDVWAKANETFEKSLRDKYFGTAKLPAGLVQDSAMEISLELPSGKGVSPFDQAFRSAASSSRFDWRLIAAVAFVESRFKTDLVSWAGARGVMQVMPATARAMGFQPESLANPDVCIRAGVKLLETLDKQLASKIPDPEARIDFVLAAYNAGLGHIYDSIALARKYGLGGDRWSGGVEQAALMKSRPEYYRDPVVRNGYFRGRETIDFVKRVRATYESFRTKG